MAIKSEEEDWADANRRAFPAGYERLSPLRSEEDVWAEINRKAGFTTGTIRRKASTELAPPPEEDKERVPKARGREAKAPPPPPVPAAPVTVIGRPSASDKATAKKLSCPHSGDWTIIGQSRTKGKLRRRCLNCQREETVLATDPRGEEYRPKSRTIKG